MEPCGVNPFAVVTEREPELTVEEILNAPAKARELVVRSIAPASVHSGDRWPPRFVHNCSTEAERQRLYKYMEKDWRAQEFCVAWNAARATEEGIEDVEIVVREREHSERLRPAA
jgi:hypothetical protein